MTDIIRRAIRVAEEAGAGSSRPPGNGPTANGTAGGTEGGTEWGAEGSGNKVEEARAVAEGLGRLGLLELLEEAFDHLVEDISHDITPEESDELATRIDEVLRDAGYFDTELGDRQQ